MKFHPLSVAIKSAVFVSFTMPAMAAVDESQSTTRKEQIEKIEVVGEARSGYRVDEVSQVGPWHGRELKDLPFSINVLSADLVENVQAVNSDQLFRINPTTQLRRSQYENDQTAVNMRGFSVQTFYRDGVPADQYGHGTTTEDVEQIEVLTGLSGFMYGPGNVGGVVNYVSKRPTTDHLNKITLGHAGGQSLYQTADFGGPIDDQGTFGYRVVAANQQGETATEQQELRKQFISGAFDWNIADNLLLQFNLAHRNYELTGAQAYWALASGVARPDAAQFDTRRSYGQPWTKRDYENQKWGANLRWIASDAISVRAVWQDNNSVREISSATNTIQKNGSYNQSISGFYHPDNNPMLSEQIDERGQTFVDMKFNTGSVSHKLSSGVTYSKNVQQRFQSNVANINFSGLSLSDIQYKVTPAPALINRGLSGNVIDGTTTTWSIGDDIKFNDQWSMLAGIGHSTIDDAKIEMVFLSPAYKDAHTSPTLSLIYQPSSDITTYVSVIEAFERGGQAAELYQGVSVVNAGQVFEPLVSKQLEAGIKTQVGALLLSGAVFQIDRGLQYYDLTIPTAPRYVQDGRQEHRGLEFSAVGEINPQLSVIGGFTWLDAAITEQKQNPALEGKTPAQVAEKVAKLHFEYQLAMMPELTLSGGLNYNGDQFGNEANTDQIDGYTLADIGVRYETQLAASPLAIRLDINNLTNKKYWANAGYLGDPRALMLSATWQF